MNRVFRDFVDCLFESTSPDGYREAMANAATALDLPFFAYLSLRCTSDTLPALISSYPRTWTAYYLQNRYEQVDPVILWALKNRESFEWGLGAGPLKPSVAQQRLFEEAAQFDIRCGFTIPLHDECGTIAAVTFAAAERYPAFHRQILHQSCLLQLMATCLHAHVRRRMSDSAGARLTPRERECIRWAAEGKSSWEIGGILGISRLTAAFHLDNARAKLGARTIAQAIAMLAKLS